MSANARSLTPTLVVGAAAVLSAATLGLAWHLGLSPSGFLAGNQASQWLAGLAIATLGAVVLRAGHNRLGPLLASFGLLAALGCTSQQYAEWAHRDGLPAAGAAAWAASNLWVPAFIGPVFVLPLLFPHGRLASPRWRWPARIGAVAGVLGFLGLATTQEALDSSGFGWATNPLDLPFADGPQLAVAGVGFVAPVLVGFAAAVAIVVRMRHVPPAERADSAWFIVAVLLALATHLPLPVPVSFALTVTSVAALGIGIVRYRLFDIEAYLPRAVAYAACIGLAVGVYLAVTALVSAQADPGVLAALATAITALLLARVLGRAQAGIARLLFGDRSRPQAVLDALGERLAATVDPDEVLPASVDAVCRSLRLPHAAVTFKGEDFPASAAGAPTRHTASFPLRHAGEDVGTLTVGMRSGERELDEQDTRVLEGFARQVAIAAHGVQVTRELRRSREQVVLAREEERRRIHRDLHDGLGPALAGISLGLETAGRVVSRDGDSAAALLEELRAETTACVDDVRRIVSDLRPPVLDELGLLAALHHHAELLTGHAGGRLTVDLVDAQPLGELPPAVEVAAYRITTEALTNAARHSGATRCSVTVSRAESLRVLVRDNGTGKPPLSRGTGLDSMRQRAEELGGRCVVTFRPGRGTVVEAALPLGPAGSAGSAMSAGTAARAAAPVVAQLSEATRASS